MRAGAGDLSFFKSQHEVATINTKYNGTILFFSLLIPELLQYILLFLSVRESVHARLVCKSLKAAVDNEMTQKEQTKREFCLSPKIVDECINKNFGLFKIAYCELTKMAKYAKTFCTLNVVIADFNEVPTDEQLIRGIRSQLEQCDVDKHFLKKIYCTMDEATNNLPMNSINKYQFVGCELILEFDIPFLKAKNLVSENRYADLASYLSRVHYVPVSEKNNVVFEVKLIDCTDNISLTPP